MKPHPRTPTGNRLACTAQGKSRIPQTPNTRANAAAAAAAPSQGRQSGPAGAGGGAGPGSGGPGPAGQTARAWRTGGDRKIMFESRVGHALVPEMTRPRCLVGVLNICAWLLLADGTFQVAISKLSNFVWPLHWVGVLLMLLGLVTMGVRIYAGRCGTSPQCASGIAVLTIGACLTAWLVCEGPLYADVKIADTCDEQTAAADCPGSDCVCYDDDDADWSLCVTFAGSCENIPSNRRYLVMSLFSLWIALGLAIVVASVSFMIITGRGDNCYSSTPFSLSSSDASVRFNSKKARGKTTNITAKLSSIEPSRVPSDVDGTPDCSGPRFGGREGDTAGSCVEQGRGEAGHGEGFAPSV